jgi:hypothetical protein
VTLHGDFASLLVACYVLRLTESYAVPWSHQFHQATPLAEANSWRSLRTLVLRSRCLRVLLKAVDYILSYTITTITITDEDPAYDALVEWLVQRKPWHNATAYETNSHYELKLPVQTTT